MSTHHRGKLTAHPAGRLESIVGKENLVASMIEMCGVNRKVRGQWDFVAVPKHL